MILVAIDNPQQMLLAVQAVKIAAINGDLTLDEHAKEIVISEMHALDTRLTRELAIWNKERLEQDIIILERKIEALESYLKHTEGTAAYAPLAAQELPRLKQSLEQMKQRRTSI